MGRSRKGERVKKGPRLPHRWDECTWPEIREMSERGAVVVVPTASTEQHGPHLPLCTDALIVGEIADRAVRQAGSRVAVLLAPTVTAGCSRHHMGFPGTLTVDELTFVDTVTQLGLSIASHGFRRLLFLNGHGGNRAALEIAISRIHGRTGALCAASNYWAYLRDVVGRERRSELGGIGHACEFETAAVMAIRPDLVKGTPQAGGLGAGDEYWTTDWYGNSQVALGFSVDDLSSSGVLGDPGAATTENGARWLRLAVTEVARFIVRLSNWKVQGARARGSGNGLW